LIDWHAANNTGIPENLILGSDEDLDPFHPEDFSDDGNFLVISGRATPASGLDIGLIDLRDPVQVRWIIVNQFTQTEPDISPDGRWIAYQSNESGRVEVYIRPFPNVDDNRWLVSPGGGLNPRWSRSGNTLYYVQPGNPDMLMSINIDAQGDELGIEQVTPVIEWPYQSTFDVSEDEQRFLAVKPLEDEGQADGEKENQVHIVQNWIEEVRQRLGTN